MRLLSPLVLLIFVLTSCSSDEDRMRPGEKYSVDTTMFREYQKIDSIVKIECDRITDSIFRKAYDSLLRIRSKDIRSIKGDGQPPVENRFPATLEKLRKKQG
ncbi:MAG TPA: hypothetical protein PLC76_12090 [Saprospiraceae bacterium]|nr:MAG: hypothetical protein UZ08_BCD001001467 [Candidatus Parvibacillus calidus]MBX2938077.1 hypothetical protein [Saprospiraceae bacterium]MBX7178721.1 hypothetical protein [Saprospiraceae bacterium]MCB0591797.1 hypothetical protein [Saprospiraceae bacterium]MCC7147794.1 hypothetical protein [Saprospiraceae bacterium]